MGIDSRYAVRAAGPANRSGTLGRAQLDGTVVARSTEGISWTEVIFVAFLLLIFVGLRPFAPRDTLQLQRIAGSEGDLLKQLSYILLFLLTVIFALAKSGRSAFGAVPLSVAIVAAWTFASIVWSIAPEITLRRAALNTLIMLIVLLNVHLLGADRVLRAVTLVLAATLVVNLLSVPMVPQAVHTFGEADPALVGTWRGLYFHKNIAGPTSALTALFCLHAALRQKSTLHYGLFFGAIVFTIGSGSKTAMALLPLSIVAMWAFRWAEAKPRRRTALAVVLAATAGLSMMAIALAGDQVAELLSDRNSFTGRGSIWQLVASYVAEHPVLGAGFGAFWQSGAVSPALALARESWLLTVAHSHNGYLEMLVTTGVIGLGLCVVAFALVPFRRLFATDTAHAPLIFSVLVFGLAFNLTETALLEGDRPEWVIHMIVVALAGVGSAQKGLRGLQKNR